MRAIKSGCSGGWRRAAALPLHPAALQTHRRCLQLRAEPSGLSELLCKRQHRRAIQV